MSDSKKARLIKIKTLKSRVGSEIDFNEKTTYLNRLLTPFTTAFDYRYLLDHPTPNNFHTKSFILDYLAGDGHELSHKFWSPISSSRYAFELYSVLANWPPYQAITFEYQLPTINLMTTQRTLITPNSNMDVYFEEDQTLYFIESKFTESTRLNNIDTLAKNYYDNDSNRLSLKERYWGDEKCAQAITQFIKDIKNISTPTNLTSFFDAKQETTHLIGLIHYIHDYEPQLSNKTIKFFNVVYDFGDMKQPLVLDFVDKFKAHALALVHHLFPTIQFDYDIKTVSDFFTQELHVDLHQTQAFEAPESIIERLKQFE